MVKFSIYLNRRVLLWHLGFLLHIIINHCQGVTKLKGLGSNSRCKICDGVFMMKKAQMGIKSE